MRNTSAVPRDLITHERLLYLLEYDKNTGFFYWKRKYCRKSVEGKIAGHVLKKGYRQIRIDTILYQAHRLAWFYMYKEWPYPEVDHINRDKDDNRIVNLRLSMPGAQQFNTEGFKHNTSGVRGVSWHKATKTWRAYVQLNKKFICLGYFKTIDAAATARKNKDKEIAIAIERQLQSIAPTARERTRGV